MNNDSVSTHAAESISNIECRIFWPCYITIINFMIQTEHAAVPTAYERTGDLIAYREMLSDSITSTGDLSI